MSRRLASALAFSLLLPASALTAACGGEATQRSASAPAPSAAKDEGAAAAEAAKVAEAKAVAPASEPPPASAGAPPTKAPGAARIVALGDVHGDLAATRSALRLAGAIDAEDRWVGGELVVVQTGDQLDRGDDEREILDLLARLEGEAKAAGGALYVLNGNHELMNAAGDLRYVTAGGHLDFADVPGVDPNDPRAQRV
ncbi:MAG: metallophosphoesterase, partial [Nannocystaceae bacterium]